MVNVRKKQPSEQQINEFLDNADKPYGSQPESIMRVNVSMTTSMYEIADEIVRKRKRAKLPNRSLSALFVEALQDYMKRMDK